MAKNISKKAIKAKKWRCKARDKRQFNNIVSCYVEHKYKAIYKECSNIYQSIKDKYPDIGPKCNLAKTTMFRRIILQIDSSDDETSTSASPAETSTSASPAETETSASPAETETSASPAETATSASPAETETSASPAETATSASPAETATSASPAETETSASPAETETSASPVQPQLIPVRHLHVGYNASGELVDQLTDEGEYININSINNDVFMDIVNELEQDDDIQQLLNNVEIHPLEEPVDMDEGIELGVPGEDDDFNDIYDF